MTHNEDDLNNDREEAKRILAEAERLIQEIRERVKRLDALAKRRHDALHKDDEPES